MLNAFFFLISLVTMPIVSMDKQDKQLYKRPRVINLHAVITICQKKDEAIIRLNDTDNTADKKHVIDSRIDNLEQQIAILEKALLTKKTYSNCNATPLLYE